MMYMYYYCMGFILRRYLLQHTLKMFLAYSRCAKAICHYVSKIF